MPSAKLLRDLGFDVKDVAKGMFGISDNEVVTVAQREDRIILTFDSDYGEIIYHHGIENPPAVIYFRDKGSEPLFAGQILQRLIKKGDGIFVALHYTIQKTSTSVKEGKNPITPLSRKDKHSHISPLRGFIWEPHVFYNKYTPTGLSIQPRRGANIIATRYSKEKQP